MSKSKHEVVLAQRKLLRALARTFWNVLRGKDGAYLLIAVSEESQVVEVHSVVVADARTTAEFLGAFVRTAQGLLDPLKGKLSALLKEETANGNAN